MILATVILSPHLYFYDLTIVLLPLLLLWTGSRQLVGEHKKLASYLTMLIVIMLFCAGAFKDIAATTGIQPSVVILVLMLLVIARILKRSAGQLE